MTPSFSNNAFHPRPVVYDKHTFILSSASEASSSDSIEVEVASNEFDWDQIAKDVFKNDKRPVILFDGVCNLCNGGVNFALDNDSVGKLTLLFTTFLHLCLLSASVVCYRSMHKKLLQLFLINISCDFFNH